MNLRSRRVLAFAACTLLGLLLSPASWALGLGEARVESWLHQPLDARVRLISRSEAELATVTAALASAEDFRVIGLDRQALSVPLTFEVVARLDDPHIRIRSSLPINEPVLQLVVEVVWASGRMLRQYTLFLDPPAFDSAAPLPGVSQPSSQAQVVPAAPVAPVLEPAQQPADEPPPEAVVGPASEPVDETTPEPVDAPAMTAPSQPRVLAAPPAQEGADSYGPVQRGETLWGIASRWSREQGYSVNQVMLAIQQQNPGAFNRQNINSLRAGSVLRMPSREQVSAIDARLATQEVLQQEQEYLGRPVASVTGAAEDLPVVAGVALGEAADGPGGDADADADADADQAIDAPADETQDPLADTGADAALDPDVAAGHLELVPPAAGEDAAPDAGTGNAESEAEAGVSVVEELARAQEELANAKLENEYLAERIGELEAELERLDSQGPGAQDADGAGIEDSSLAEMEQSLREQRQAGAEQELAVISPAAEKPALRPWLPWFLALLAVLIGGGVWWLRRRAEGDHAVLGLQQDAEDIPRALGGEGETAAGGTPTQPQSQRAPAVAAQRSEEAVELDADDPETQLDLARAYLSMGDLRSARGILERVLAHGDEAHVEEARRMMKEL